MTKMKRTTNKTFDFRHKDVNDEETKEKHRNDPFASVVLLGEVISAIANTAQRFRRGEVVLFSEVCLSKDMWDCINFARLWPETHYQEVDCMLQDALAHVADAHFMIEGAWAWGNEDNQVYANTFPKIERDLQFAIDYLQEALELIDKYIYDNFGGDDE